MHCLWDFIAEYSSTSSQFIRKRLPTKVYKDLTWWNKFVPTFNGVLFFETKSRHIIQVYIDACFQELGGFYYFGHKLFWDQTIQTLEQSKAFMTSISSWNYINIHKLGVPLVEFDIWAESWYQCKVILYTNNTIVFNGLTNLMLCDPSNKPL